MEHDDLQTPANTDDFDSACSTPFVSAPSSPGHSPSGFFYSAPASPIHFMLSSSSSSYSTFTPFENSNTSFEFEFTKKEAAAGTPPTGSMTSADELFLNGQIRPMNLLSPLHEIDDAEERGRYRSKSLRRRARSMSPMRTSDDHFQWLQQQEDEITEHKPKSKIDQVVANETNTNNNNNETTSSGVSSRSSSVGRSSNRWVFLKEFLYRSKSEGRNSTSSNNNNNNNNNKFWTSLSFSPNNEKKLAKTKNKEEGTTAVKKKAVNGVEMRRVGRSAHERHYTLNRAQAEEMRKKTYLPYKQGLLGCLGFSSKSYGAMNGFARALNPVSSR